MAQVQKHYCHDQKNWQESQPNKDGMVRTTCRICGRFIGLRPFDIRPSKSRSKKLDGDSDG